MRYTYTDTEVRISPFMDEDASKRFGHAYITVHKPYMDGEKRVDARITWSRFSQQYPISGYQFAQGLFVAAGLADVFNLVEDMEAIRKFGQT